MPKTSTPANATPKQRFMESPDNVTRHRDLIADTSFLRAADAAMLEYQARNLPNTNAANDSMGYGFKVQGAIEFLQVFKQLAEEQSLPRNAAPVLLDHKV